MLLAIDIGNTNIVLGLWDGGRWRLQWRLSTVRERTADEYGLDVRGLLQACKVKKRAVTQVVISSVVPKLTAVFGEVGRRYLAQQPLVVTHQTDMGLTIQTDFPEQVGADRLVNATAAYHRFGGACIVVDMGTATKYDVVSRQGAFLGGIISPGLQITADALFARAAKLSQVEFVAPPTAIGRNTVHALQAGLIYGYASQIDGLIPRLQAEMCQLDEGLTTAEIHIIGTGGLISLIAPHTRTIATTDPWLTLSGLQTIAARSQPNG
jgi:type III pantothenate kinase